MMQKLNLSFGKIGICCALLLCVLLVWPVRSHGQFGIDPCCAIISAGLRSISSLLSNAVAKPLSTIQQTQQQMSQFEQQVVWPVSAIAQAKQAVVRAQGQFTQIATVSRLPVSSATLPTTQQLERSLLSRNSASLPSLGPAFTSVYGSPIPSNDAPIALRNVSDMADAEAQAAMKRAVELDAIADLEMNAANQLNEQLQNAAPGSAEILAAEAATWQVRGNAFSQMGMAELLRVRSVQLANQSAMLKFSSSHAKSASGVTGAVVTQGVK